MIIITMNQNKSNNNSRDNSNGYQNNFSIYRRIDLVRTMRHLERNTEIPEIKRNIISIAIDSIAKIKYKRKVYFLKKLI